MNNTLKVTKIKHQVKEEVYLVSMVSVKNSINPCTNILHGA
jgi:hypothetical protein